MCTFREVHHILCVRQGLTIALLLEAGAAAAQQIRNLLLCGMRARNLRGLSSAALCRACECCRLLRMTVLTLEPRTHQPSSSRHAMMRGTSTWLHWVQE